MSQTTKWGSVLGVFGSCLVAAGLLFAESPELVLEGVIVSANPAHSIALVRVADAQRARSLRIGQQYRGYVLRQVARGAVVLEGGDGLLRLSLGTEVTANNGDEGRPWDAEVTAKNGDEGRPWDAEVTAKNGDEGGWVHRSFSRVRARERLEREIPAILSDTELAPRVEDGEIRGIELRRLPDGTLLSESGLFPGDVLKSINGEPIRGLDTLWATLARLQEASKIRLVLERRGEVVRLAYDFKN